MSRCETRLYGMGLCRQGGEELAGSLSFSGGAKTGEVLNRVGERRARARNIAEVAKDDAEVSINLSEEEEVRVGAGGLQG